MAFKLAAFKAKTYRCDCGGYVAKRAPDALALGAWANCAGVQKPASGRLRSKFCHCRVASAPPLAH